MSGFRPSDLTRTLTLAEPLVLESGAVLAEVTVAYRTWGTLSPRGDNAIVVCHALTGSADVDLWWSGLFGPGRALDPTRHFIVCSNVLGGCYGTTGPLSSAPDGQPWGPRFPSITIRDQVRLQIRLADELGMQRILSVVGGSMGGLQALEWAYLDPFRVQSVVSIAAAGRHPVWCQAWSEAQRLALRADPYFQDGHYAPERPPRAGLAAARAVAMVSYRSPLGLEERFGGPPPPATDVADAPAQASVRTWLAHHGAALSERFDANAYLTLIDAMDTHDLARGRGAEREALQRLQLPVLIGSIGSDALYLPAEQQRLAAALPRAELVEIGSRHGHDGFLIDAHRFNEPLLRFLARVQHLRGTAPGVAPGAPAHSPSGRSGCPGLHFAL